MNWTDAVAAMKRGEHVRRASTAKRTLIGHSEGIPIYDCGEESCFLAHAWTDDNKPVRVFVGSGSKAHFVPDGDHVGATDWEVVAGGPDELN